jgi:hypothetical protein
MAYQIAKRSKELKRDLEFALVQNQDSTAGTASAGSEMGGLESWLSSNKTSSQTSAGGATTPGYASGEVGAPTDSSPVGTFTKANLDAIISATWLAGGDPRIIMTGPFNKARLSGFVGIATLYKEVPGLKQGTIVGGADVYVSNFGEHTVVPNRFQRDRTVFVLDMDYWAVAYLRPFTQHELAKTGDSMRRQLLCEATLVSRNEAASGKITDNLTV